MSGRLAHTSHFLFDIETAHSLTGSIDSRSESDGRTIRYVGGVSSGPFRG